MAVDSGLAGLVAAETVLSHADGAGGILWVRGHTLDDLVANYGYDGAVGVLWDGFAAAASDGPFDRAAMRTRLGIGREKAFGRLGEWLDAAAGRPPIEAMRLALAALPEGSAPADILASLPVAAAAILRRRQGLSPVAPDPERGTADDLLRMVHGAPAAPVLAQGIDDYFAALIDNGLSNSGFTARIIASSRASLVSAALGAYCAFTGPLHGGAPGPTLDLFDEAAAAPDLDAWAEAKLAAGARLMGFGHRVFPQGDPRAAILRRALDRIAAGEPEVAHRLAFAREIEGAVGAAFARLKPGRPPLQPNVEINAALLLDAVGLPRDAFMPAFAVSRCAGWLAHAMEQRRENRLVRPGAAYIGPVPPGAEGPG